MSIVRASDYTFRIRMIRHCSRRAFEQSSYYVCPSCLGQSDVRHAGQMRQFQMPSLNPAVASALRAALGEKEKPGSPKSDTIGSRSFKNSPTAKESKLSREQIDQDSTSSHKQAQDTTTPNLLRDLEQRRQRYQKSIRNAQSDDTGVADGVAKEKAKDVVQEGNASPKKENNHDQVQFSFSAPLGKKDVQLTSSRSQIRNLEPPTSISDYLKTTNVARHSRETFAGAIVKKLRPPRRKSWRRLISLPKKDLKVGGHVKEAVAEAARTWARAKTVAGTPNGASNDNSAERHMAHMARISRVKAPTELETHFISEGSVTQGLQQVNDFEYKIPPSTPERALPLSERLKKFDIPENIKLAIIKEVQGHQGNDLTAAQVMCMHR